MPKTSAAVPFETMAELLERIGDVAPHRIRLRPPPGMATERDLIRIHNRTDRLYELVDGVLVEKVMGYGEASLAFHLGRLLGNFVAEHNLGNLAGADGAMRLMPGLVRIPDISLVSWDRLPGRKIPRVPIAGLAPDLAIEVLSESNTKTEMERKLKDYFLSGVRLVWFVDMERRTVEVFTAPDESVLLTEEQTLDGGDVVPGLALPLRDVFANVPLPQKPRGGGKGKARKRGKSS
jgi:Uma2 family endonuclease